MAWQIDDDLWVASRPTREDHLTGFTALVSVNYQVPPREVLDHFLGLWSHIPLSDGKRVDELRAKRAATHVLWLLHRDYRVLVHCDAGRNRSGLVAALVVRERHGLTGEQAIDWIRERRPRALANEAQVEWLRSLHWEQK